MNQSVGCRVNAADTIQVITQSKRVYGPSVQRRTFNRINMEPKMDIQHGEGYLRLRIQKIGVSSWVMISFWLVLSTVLTLVCAALFIHTIDSEKLDFWSILLLIFCVLLVIATWSANYYNFVLHINANEYRIDPMSFTHKEKPLPWFGFHRIKTDDILEFNRRQVEFLVDDPRFGTDEVHARELIVITRMKQELYIADLPTEETATRAVKLLNEFIRKHVH